MPRNIEFDADVVIVGCGPTGKLLALLLGRKGYRVTVIERHQSPYSLPRAVAFDDEIARLLADIGIDPDHNDSMVYMDEWYFLENGRGETLAALDWTGLTPAGRYAHYFFHQPGLEMQLGEMIAALESVKILRGWEADEVKQSDDGVELSAVRTDETGALIRQRCKAKFLVGADGANSFVRKALGLPMHDLGFRYDWLIVDLIPKSPLHFRSSMLQVCDPARPTTLMPAGGGRRRWEFMVLPGEDTAVMNSEAVSWRLLQPWNVTAENATLERHTVWRFQAQWSDTWHKSRAVIAGDAAHLMPPFAGQGMCAGLRDASNLAWRLDLILGGVAGVDLLRSYGEERKEHVRYFIDFSIDLGRAVCVLDPQEAEARDAAMKAAMADPSLAPPPVPHPRLGAGAWSPDEAGAGQLSRQGVVRLGEREDRLDQLTQMQWLLLTFDADLMAGLAAQQRDQLQRIGTRCIVFGAGAAEAMAQDIHGFYRAWFDELSVDAILIRPDRYVAAASRKETFGRSLAHVLSALQLTASTSSVAVAG